MRKWGPTTQRCFPVQKTLEDRGRMQKCFGVQVKQDWKYVERVQKAMHKQGTCLGKGSRYDISPTYLGDGVQEDVQVVHGTVENTETFIYILGQAVVADIGTNISSPIMEETSRRKQGLRSRRDEEKQILALNSPPTPPLKDANLGHLAAPQRVQVAPQKPLWQFCVLFISECLLK